jgi:hypothetical protein
MSRLLEARQVFKHHQMYTEEDMKATTIRGTNGAFQELLRAHGGDVKEPTIGVGVTFNAEGVILGTRLLLCGAMAEVKLHTRDFYPGATEHGNVVIQKTDIGNWVMPNGRLTSYWAKREDNALNWSIKVTTGGRSKTIRFPKHGDYLFGDMVTRLNVQPTSVDFVKVSMGAAPVDGDGLSKLDGFNSRAFSTIAVNTVRARIFPKEREGQNLGLGFMPIMILTGADGEIDLNNVIYPTSMDVKEAAVALLQSSTKPNEEINATLWKEKVDNHQSYELLSSALMWPKPRQEDDANTSDSTASVDTEGEKHLL